MRHGKKFNHLGRKSAHRKAMLSNMASSLFLHKRIKTTLPKAKELRKFVEPLLTRAKLDSTHSRRVVFSYLQNKESLQELFGPISNAIADRPGGYTRILKIGPRKGDNAEMAIIELVDFNEMAPGKAGGSSESKSRRRRRSGGKKKSGGDSDATKTVAAAAVVDEVEEIFEEAEIVEETPEETPAVEAEATDAEDTDAAEEEKKED